MKDMFRLDGKIAVVLGGAGGIGQACAEAMASRGAKVVVAGRTFSKVQEVAGRITSDMGGEATPLSVDVTLEESVARLRDQVVEKYKTIDILINAHGINLKSPALELTVEGWDSIFATNTRGTMLSCKAFGEIMVEKRKGKIINLSSVRGIRGTGGGNTAYGATKGAVDMITRMLAAEWAPHNVNVNALAPSVILTDIVKKHVAPERLEMLLTQVPLKRFCTLDDVTGACVYLASAESDFVTGQIFYIDGGITAVG